MRMHAVTDFTILPGPEQDPFSQLFVRGRNVGPIEGRRIEAQFGVDHEGYLVIATYDVPYEESVILCLFDSEFRLIHRRRLGRAFQPGVLSEIRLKNDGVEFCFPQKQHWLASVDAVRRFPYLARPRLRIGLRRTA